MAVVLRGACLLLLLRCRSILVSAIELVATDEPEPANDPDMRKVTIGADASVQSNGEAWVQRSTQMRREAPRPLVPAAPLASPQAVQGDSMGTQEVLPSADITLSESSGAKLFFLFMAKDRLPNEEIWLRFFSAGRHGTDYAAWVHCQDGQGCREQIRSRGIFQIIPTVASEWCVDLVSPMDALLAAALSSDIGGSSYDKFVFVSDTTVPIKPFRQVQRQLLVDDRSGSDFCVTPIGWWAFKQDDESLAIKHYQWTVLNRYHSEQVLRKKGQWRNLTQVTSPYNLWKSRWFLTLWDTYLGEFLGRMHPTGCLDEYYYFHMLFGFKTRRTDHQEERVPGLNGGPLSLADDNRTADFQGVCNTFDFFGYGKRFLALVDVLKQDNATSLILQDEGRLHPARFATLSNRSLSELRRSEFLFARKVDAQTEFTSGSNLADAFDSLVFSSSAPML